MSIKPGPLECEAAVLTVSLLQTIVGVRNTLSERVIEAFFSEKMSEVFEAK